MALVKIDSIVEYMCSDGSNPTRDDVSSALNSLKSKGVIDFTLYPERDMVNIELVAPELMFYKPTLH